MDNKIKNVLREKFNKICSGTKYYKSVGEAVNLIESALKEQGVVAVNEDNTKLEGIYTGETGEAFIDLAPAQSEKNGRMRMQYLNYLGTNK